MIGEERRSRGTFEVDQEKFATQRSVTFILLGVFIGVTIQVLYQNDQSERSMILQTVINLTLLAVGYWLGASKQAADTGGTLGKIAEGAAPAQARAVAAARAPAPETPVEPPPEPGPSPGPVVTPAAPNPETGVVPAKEVAQPEKDKP